MPDPLAPPEAPPSRSASDTTIRDQADPLPLSAPDSTRALTWRVLLLGNAAILTICALAPYNDFTLGNTPLIGNYLPISVVILTFLFVVAINGPLSRYSPRHAFSQGEIALLLVMVLAGCAIPTTGLMRYFMPSLIAPQYLAGANPEFAALLRSLKLPHWLFPSFASSDPSQWPNDPVVTGYMGRWSSATPYPYTAFLKPLLTWGIFFALFAAAMVSLVRIAYAQWALNERLAFPLAQIQIALIEPPEPGRWLNSTLQSRTFWLGLLITFTLHIWNGLSVYTANRVPAIPLSYDLTGLFREPPLSYTDTALYKSQIFLTAVAVTYFLRLPISFSLWFFFVLQQITRMLLGTASGDPDIPGQTDFTSGAFLGFTLMTLYVGRRHFWNTLKATLGLTSPPNSADLPSQALSGRVLLASVIGMTLWLVCAGSTFAGALTLVLTLLLLLFGLTRIVAETGLLHANLFMPLSRPFTLAAQLSLARAPNETYFFVRYLHCIFYDQRECLPVYAANGLRIANPQSGQFHRSLLTKATLVIALALLIAYFASAFFHLRNEYTYAATLGQASEFPIDSWGAKNNWAWQFIPGLTAYAQDALPPAGPAPVAAATGMLSAVALYSARLLFPAWPLHPVGLVMLSSYSLSAFWASFFLAWLLKAAVIRFGGYSLYNRTRPFAIGLITGESLAAATWLLTAIVRSQLNLPFFTVNVLPR
jgi:hypothetical protein